MGINLANQVYDFSGWATKNDLKCADGRIIKRGAFSDNDGVVVPLVWEHFRSDPKNVLGHALLKNMDDGVYAYGVFNNTEYGNIARELVKHGDIQSLSIWANQLRQIGSEVLHGMIREVSLVIAGANPGARIECVLEHGDYMEDADEVIICTGEPVEASDWVKTKLDAENTDEIDTLSHADSEDSNDEKPLTVGNVLKTMNEDQRKALLILIDKTIENYTNDAEDENDDDKSDVSKKNGESTKKNKDEGGTDMKHNIFDKETTNDDKSMQHSADLQAVIADGKRYGSMRESAIAHGITDIDYLFPDAKNVTPTPGFISRDMGWVSIVMNSVHRSPFSRIKSIFADITEDDARAKGYTKGKQKKDEVFSLLKRTTTPGTIYKKQKLDRDDVIDITDFDVISWIKREMRTMLDEEIARAILIGDGRLASSDDKISEDHIRPIYKDDSLYSIKAVMDVVGNSGTAPTADEKSKSFIRAAIKARKDYQGSGSPIMFTTEDVLTDCLLMEDKNGRIIYDSVSKLASVLRVKDIVTVPVMEKVTRTDTDTYTLMAIIVNLSDYMVGADKGGAVNMFSDFDIDFNAQKYLIETRCSGALVVPKSAIVIEYKTLAGATEDEGEP